MDQASIIDRPKLAHWMWVRDLTPADAAQAVDCSEQAIRNICRPFGHPQRAIPREPLMERILRWTKGDVAAPDYYPPALRGPFQVPDDIQ